MTKVESLKARLSEATAAVEKFELDADFVAKRKALEAAETEATRVSEAAHDHYAEVRRAAGIRLGFYTQDWKFRKSYIGAIAEKIGIAYEDRKVLARGNRSIDDPFGRAARTYADNEVMKDDAVAAAYAHSKVKHAARVKAQHARYAFLSGYNRANYDKRSIEYDLREALRVAEERKEKIAEAAGGEDASSVTRYREQRAKYRAARKLLEEIAEGRVKLNVPR